MESEDNTMTAWEVPDKVNFQRTRSKDESGDARERKKPRARKL